MAPSIGRQAATGGSSVNSKRKSARRQRQSHRALAFSAHGASLKSSSYVA